MQPQNLNQAILFLKKKIEEETRLMAAKKAELAATTGDITKLQEGIRTHEQEIKAKEAEIAKLRIEISKEKSELTQDERTKKPKLEQEVNHLMNEKSTQERDLAAAQRNLSHPDTQQNQGGRSGARPIV